MTMTTATAKPPIEPHEIHRDRLLAHAREMLEADDRVQASEKIWGALSHAVSDIAKRRGWPLGEEYIDKKDVARYIGEQADSPQISRLYSAVYSFHTNFHKDEEEPAVIGEGIEMAEELVGLLTCGGSERGKRRRRRLLSGRSGRSPGAASARSPGRSLAWQGRKRH